MPDAPTVTDADRAAALAVLSKDIACESCEECRRCHGRDGEKSRMRQTCLLMAEEVIHDAMAPERARAARVEKALEWLLVGDTGLSSRCLLAHMLGIELSEGLARNRHPSDVADFNRCQGLLEVMPAFRARMGEMSVVSREWRMLVGQWEKIEEAKGPYKDVRVHALSDEDKYRWRRAYTLMEDTIFEARAALEDTP